MVLKHLPLVLFAIIFSNVQLFGQEWEQHYKQAQELMDKGDFEKADEEAQKCLAIYQQNQGGANTTYASILRLLQNTSYNKGNFEKAIEYSQKEIKNSFGESEKRYIIKTTIRIGKKRIKSVISLTDRGTMRYPVLIGRKLIKNKFAVDVSLLFNLTEIKK